MEAFTLYDPTATRGCHVHHVSFVPGDEPGTAWVVTDWPDYRGCELIAADRVTEHVATWTARGFVPYSCPLVGRVTLDTFGRAVFWRPTVATVICTP